MMSTFAGQRNLEVWYARADVDDLRARLGQRMTNRQRTNFTRTLDKAKSRDSLRALNKLTAVVDGRRAIRPDPPLVVPIADLLPDLEGQALRERFCELLLDSRPSLLPGRSRLLDDFEIVDMARKVVGVGSVG